MTHSLLVSLYKIEVQNPEGREKGVRRLLVDGVEFAPGPVPADGKKEIDIKVIM